MTVVASEIITVSTPLAGPAGERSLSVVVTAMNEEGNLQPAIDSIVGAVAPRFSRFEIIVIDDGSTDGTPEVAASIAAANPFVRVHRNSRNMGVGFSYHTGIELAACEYTSWVAGNNLVPQWALERIYDRVGERDMVISYLESDARNWRRRLISQTFTRIMNVLFSVRMRYYTGPCVFKSGIAKRLPFRAHGSTFIAEVLVRLLRARQTYVEVGIQAQPRSSGSTKTFRVRNILDVFVSAMTLFWELRVRSPQPAMYGSDACTSGNK